MFRRALGLVAVGQRLDLDRAVIECRVAEPDPCCRGCGSQGAVPRDGRAGVSHEPLGLEC